MSTLFHIVKQDVFIALICVLVATPVSIAADPDSSWPQFHGSKRDNISDEIGLLKKWPDKGPPLLWTADGLGHGFSSLSIAAGRVYTAGNIEKDTVITALDLNGNVLWRAVNGRAWTRDKYYPGARSTPTIDGNRVYHRSPLGNIICLEAETGDIVWELDILNKVGSKNSTWALAESLLIDGDHVISCPGGPETCMVALDKNTGEVVWKATSKGSLTYADGMFYTLSMDRVMGLVWPSSNGLELVSSFEIPKGGKGESWAHPVVCGGRLYILHGDYLYSYNVR